MKIIFDLSYHGPVLSSFLKMTGIENIILNMMSLLFLFDKPATVLGRAFKVIVTSNLSLVLDVIP